MGMTLPTYYAPPEKERWAILVRQSESLSADPLVDQILDALPEPTLILNATRQIVRANERTGELLGTPREDLLGLRLGEAIRCPRASASPPDVEPRPLAVTAVPSGRS